MFNNPYEVLCSKCRIRACSLTTTPMVRQSDLNIEQGGVVLDVKIVSVCWCLAVTAPIDLPPASDSAAAEAPSLSSSS